MLAIKYRCASLNSIDDWDSNAQLKQRGMRLLTMLLVLGLFYSTGIGQTYVGPIPEPLIGYGASGPYDITKQNLPAPLWPERSIWVYTPSGVSEPVPAIFFCHAYGADSIDGSIPGLTLYQGLINQLVSQGFGVVFVPYPGPGDIPATASERYQHMEAGIVAAARRFASILDSTRVGFVGHSFGAGATLALSFNAYVGRNWGLNGRFVYAMAPWYQLAISDQERADYPANVNLLVQVFEDDTENDHRMAIDFFRSLPIPDGNKDYLYLKSGAIDGYNYLANHGVPITSNALETPYDAYDSYAIHRPLHALAAYSLLADAEAFNTALGGGSNEQVTLPSFQSEVLPPLEVSDTPVPRFPENTYTYPCSSPTNPRASQCILLSNEEKGNAHSGHVSVAPNPASSHVLLNIGYRPSCQILAINGLGQQVCLPAQQESEATRVDITSLPIGMYLLVVMMEENLYTTRLVIQR